MLPNEKRRAEAQTPLNQRIELWNPQLSIEKDALGGDVDVAGKVATMAANVSRIRGMEMMESGRMVPYAYYKIRIHFRKDIDEAMYLVYEGRELQINSIIDLQERHMYLELQCTERVVPSHG